MAILSRPVGGTASRRFHAGAGAVLVGVLILASAWALTAPARGSGDILRESYAPASWTTDFLNVYSGQAAAQSFVAHTSYLLTHVELYVFNQPQASTSDYLQVSIAADGAGAPGAVLGTSAQQGVQNWSWVPFSFYPWIPLTAGRTYWIVASDAQPRPKGYEWAENVPGGYASGTAEWFDSVANAWVNTTGDLFFASYGISGPALTLAVTPQALPVNPGAVVPLGIYFNNTGNEAAGAVSISVALSSYLSYAGDNASSAGGSPSGPLTWSFADVGVGPHAMAVWVQVATSRDYYDGESLPATVRVNYTDLGGASQPPLTALATFTVLVPIVDATVNAHPAHLDPGEAFNFTVSFMNLGSGPAEELWLNLTPGPRVTVTGCTAAAAGGVLLGAEDWLFTNVTGLTYSFNVSAVASASALPGDRLDLVAIANFTDGLDHAFGSVRAVGEASIHGPSLVIEGTAPMVSVHPGNSFEVFLYANNTGDINASHVWINGTVSTMAALTSVQPAASVAAGSIFSYALTNVAPGPFAAALTLQASPAADPGAPLSVSAHLDVANITGVLLRPSNVTVAVVAVTPRFTVGLAASASVVHPGDALDLAIVVNNTGDEAARTLWVNLSLPDKALFVNASLQPTSANGTTLVWELADVGPGSRTIDVHMEMSARLTGSEALVARVALAYLRSDGALFSYPNASVLGLQGAAGASLPFDFETALTWASTLTALFLFFVLLSYMDILPRRRTAIDDVFLLHNSGILICHYSTTLRPDVDSDIASGMLMAVRNFVADALRSKEGALQELRYGDYRIHMAHGRHSILVVFARGTVGRHLQERMREILRNIEANYEPVLEAWDGRAEGFKGVESFLLKLVQA